MRSDSMELFDVTIVGGGPAGLYSAFYSGLRDLKTKIIEFQPTLGGKVNIFQEKMLWDVGGQPPIVAAQFVENLVAQAKTFDPTICLETKVQNVHKEQDYFVIETNDGAQHYSKTIIIATGGGIYKPIKLAIDGAEKYEMTNLHYTIKGIERFRNHDVLISGGGNGAVDWAVELLPIAKSVTLIYRKEELTAHEAQVRNLRENGVEIMLNSELVSLQSNEQKTAIEQVTVCQNGDNTTFNIDDVIISHGYDREVSLEFDEGIRPECKDNYYLQSIGKCQTTVPGIFGAGDIVTYEDKVNLLLGTFQDAVLAVNSAKLYMNPEANKVAMVSSHNEKFREKNQEIYANV